MPISAPANSADRPSPATDGVTANLARKAGMAGPYRDWRTPMTTNPAQLPVSATRVSGRSSAGAGRRGTVPVCRATGLASALGCQRTTGVVSARHTIARG